MTIASELADHGPRLVRLALGQMLAEGMPRNISVTEPWLKDFLSRWKVWRWAKQEGSELLSAARQMVKDLSEITDPEEIGAVIVRSGIGIEFPQRYSALSKIACAYYPDRVFVQDRFARAGVGVREGTSYGAFIAEAASAGHLPEIDRSIAETGIRQALSHCGVTEQMLRMRLFDMAAMEVGRKRLQAASSIP